MANTTPQSLSLQNVQGDIIRGLPKKKEIYLFFQIEDVSKFRSQLLKLIPLITTASDCDIHRADIQEHRRQAKGDLFRVSGVNLGFSQKGLKQLGFKTDTDDKIGDAPFENGMINDTVLNDRLDEWDAAFRQDIHGLLLVTGESQGTVDNKLKEIQSILVGSIHEVKRLDGAVRPDKEDGHEHFGYLDGVSQPAVLGVDSVPLGQELVRQGIVLLGREGDTVTRPPWALDGSFLAFRYLQQRVPEFQGFVDSNNPIGAPQDLLGARLVGRWKSGAPVDLTPIKDDEKLGTDPNRNNDFRYDPLSQDRCPFAAHTRKTYPRSDLDSSETHRILRRGIPFGPEVTDEEWRTGTKHDRGLLFVSYQSNIVNGFQFIQSTWSNNIHFPFLNKPGAQPGSIPKPGLTLDHGPGFDAIIGQAPGGAARQISLNNADGSTGDLALPVEWVVTKGGEYFFTPSIPALRNKFSLNT